MNQGSLTIVDGDEKFRARDHRDPGHFWADKELVEDYLPDIGIHAFAVYMVIAYHARANTGRAWPSIKTMAIRLDVSEPTVRKALAALAEKKLIHISTRQTTAKSGNTHCLSHVYTLLEIKGVVNGVDQGGKGGLPGVVNGVDPNKNNINKNHLTREEKDSPNSLRSSEETSQKSEEKSIQSSEKNPEPPSKVPAKVPPASRPPFPHPAFEPNAVYLVNSQRHEIYTPPLGDPTRLIKELPTGDGWGTATGRYLSNDEYAGWAMWRLDYSLAPGLPSWLAKEIKPSLPQDKRDLFTADPNEVMVQLPVPPEGYQLLCSSVSDSLIHLGKIPKKPIKGDLKAICKSQLIGRENCNAPIGFHAPCNECWAIAKGRIEDAQTKAEKASKRDKLPELPHEIRETFSVLSYGATNAYKVEPNYWAMRRAHAQMVKITPVVTKELLNKFRDWARNNPNMWQVKDRGQSPLPPLVSSNWPAFKAYLDGETNGNSSEDYSPNTGKVGFPSTRAPKLSRPSGNMVGNPFAEDTEGSTKKP